MSTPTSLALRIKMEAARFGFLLAGIVPAGPALSHEFYQAWLEEGYHGEMDYLRRHAEPKKDPRRLEPGARSLIVLGHPYPAEPPAAPTAEDSLPHGRVSRYALGTDYHEILTKKLHRLAWYIEAIAGRPLVYRPLVDSSPLMEREFAARAGLGWVGRNALLIHWHLGSWLFLAEMLVDVELEYDEPKPPGKASPKPARPAFGEREGSPAALPSPALKLRESCGTCTACIEACPTGAIVADKTVDSRLCISYLTIELKGAIPAGLRPGMGDWVFGCDVCQEVCPWNRKAPGTRERALQGTGESGAPSLPALLAMDAGAFRKAFRHTPLWRPRRRGILRNAAIALGNAAAEDPRHHPAALQALTRALRDPEPLVRGAAAWAIGRGAFPQGGGLLRGALKTERDAEVREEITAALRMPAPAGMPGRGRQALPRLRTS